MRDIPQHPSLTRLLTRLPVLALGALLFTGCSGFVADFKMLEAFAKSPNVSYDNADKPCQDRLCWLSLASQSPMPRESVSLEEWIRSLWPSSIVCKTAFRAFVTYPTESRPPLH